MTDLTLKDFLTPDASKPLASGMDLSAIMPAIAGATTALSSAAASQVSDTFKQALDQISSISIADVLQASWGKVTALRDAILATRKDPTLVAMVPLLDHKITSKHSPHIDIVYSGKTLLSLPFDIALNLAVSGTILDIHQGRIAGVKAGGCIGDGSLSFGGRPLLQYKAPEFKLPGRVLFAPPPAEQA